MLVNTPVGYGDDVEPGTPAEKVKPAEKTQAEEDTKPEEKADPTEKPVEKGVKFDLKPVVGLPDGMDANFFGVLGSLTTSPLKEKPEKLEVPKDLKVVTYIKIEVKGSEIYGLLTAGESGAINGMYLDLNHDNKLEEKPVAPFYAYAHLNYSMARFNIVKVKIKDKEYGMFVSYYHNKYLNPKTKEEMVTARVTYGLVNSYVGDVKIGEKTMKIVVVDRLADGKIRFSMRVSDSLFLDKNCDGKFGWGAQGSEVVEMGEILIGDLKYVFNIDVENLCVHVTTKKVEFSTIKFNFEGATGIVVSLAQGTNYNAPTMDIKIVDGVGKAPVGVYFVRGVTFKKDGKECYVHFFGSAEYDKISIAKEAPYQLKFNLVFKYTLQPYKGDVEGKQTYRMYGYVFNRRTIEKDGKKIDFDSKVQLKVDGKEFAPPKFTVKDGEGKELIKETVGKPFC